MKRPLLLVISAPSGAGKTTLGAMLLNEFRGMRRSVSCTTRAKRLGEVDGRDYVFLTSEQFRQRSAHGCFLETASVHGHWYGTPRAPVQQALKQGLDMLLIIDVQGAKRIREMIAKSGNKNLKSAYLDVFILPPSMRELKRRLAGRGQNDKAEMRLRLKNAMREMRAGKEFTYLVVNDTLAGAYEKLHSIVIAEHCRNLKKKYSRS